MTKYKLTDEHKEILKTWKDQWIANAMSTKPMDDNDKSVMRKAIKGLYESAKLKPPPDNRIVFVDSPFIARFAGGFAAAIWYLRKNKNIKPTRAATRDATRDATLAATDDATLAATRDATRDATEDATYDATLAATDDATDDATYDATLAATNAATYAATDDATYDATYADTYADTLAVTDDATNAATLAATDDATYDATYADTYDATYDATYAATNAATYDATEQMSKSKWYDFDINSIVKLSSLLNLGEFGLKCAYLSWKLYQGGNFWSRWLSFITFFRYVAKINIDYSKWDNWENAGIHGSCRIMHEEFCIISDRPKTLLVDSQNRPHNLNGPFCEWRDGSKLYSIHGIRIPKWIVETPIDKINKKDIVNLENADHRRCLIERLGINRTIDILGAKTIDVYECKVGGRYELVLVNYDLTEDRPYLKMKNPSMELWHIEGVHPNCKTVIEALSWRNGTKTYIEPEELS